MPDLSRTIIASSCISSYNFTTYVFHISEEDEEDDDEDEYTDGEEDDEDDDDDDCCDDDCGDEDDNDENLDVEGGVRIIKRHGSDVEAVGIRGEREIHSMEWDNNI